ncbi:hypothetical protein [Celeribacter indicus]|uniref:Uncharacterized protein n=1 Tax=Celeribacter indicus TaxID=1208324 RepID=A0A0B5DZ13_9RHOB|nr:hypothetical protein [Celeribacter indicus]AJE45472.1 hypothetical protein P73_0757 [Celeribacter indicus]SDX02834.1 hypothetical protein SAMN05443573_111140 [Celeribacter indicus]
MILGLGYLSLMAAVFAGLLSWAYFFFARSATLPRLQLGALALLAALFLALSLYFGRLMLSFPI